MKSIQELWAKGLAVLPVEVRGARVDQFSYVSKKTGQNKDVTLVRLSVEVPSGDSYEQAEATFDAQQLPPWAVRGAKLYAGVSEFRREMRRLSLRIVDVIEEKDIKKAS